MPYYCVHSVTTFKMDLELPTGLYHCQHLQLPGHQVQLFRNLPLKANSRRMGGEDPQLGTPSTPQKLDSRGAKEIEEEMTRKVDGEM